ncbi:MAG: DUF2855 family protein [Myxococcota bacterium]|nr:DUF2855 family protein [Myxococcota bacterium]
MAHPDGLDFLVNRSDWKQHRFDEAEAPEIREGQVLFRVDRFAFTANNITYAVVGDMIGYWRFFPAPAGWGRLPVMGYADVVESRHADVAVGTRCFGFYPMSRYLVIRPGSVEESGIVDAAAHREGIAPTYNTYSPTEGDALHQPEHEDALMLMRGLFMTSFLADDFIGDRGFGEQAVVISSASSKTSIALGHCVSTGGRARAVGLTSARNEGFVRSLGCYDEVRTYDEVGDLDASGPVVFADMAGNPAVRRAVHEHFGSQLKHSCSIGGTHWEATQSGDDEGLPGPNPEFFFAPAQIQKRSAEWGPKELQRRIADAWSGFRSFSESWLEVRREAGRAAVARVYDDTLAGRTEPRHGHVLSLWEPGA